MVYSFEPTDWVEDNSSLFTGTISDTIIYSDEPYAFTRFTFYGTQVQLRYRSGPLRTDALITIDGKISDTLDQRFPVYQSGQAWTSPPLELGYHTINVMVSTYAQPDERVAIDGFTVINNPSSTPPATLPTLPLTTTRTISYSYDGLLRLISADASDGDDYAYSYDLAGNRTGVWVNGVRTETETYNNVNEVVGWTYDDAGNLLDDGTSTYAYDALNRQILQDSTAQVYNGDGVLVQSGRTVYAQDLALPLTQVLQVSDGTNRTNYIYGHDRLMSDAGEWYATDALGSVRLTLDNNGTAYSGATYDPWGSPERGNVGTFGFTGELQQGDNVYLRARWYNANNGTFTSIDQWSGIPTYPQTLHAYGYVGNNPINLTDPSGHCYEPIGFLRSIEPLNCSNLDKAIYISAHPNASLTQRLGANTYISTWTVSHAALLVGAGIFAWEAASWAAIAGQSYLIAHPTAATITTVAGGVAGFSDDLLMAGAALTGDADAAGQIMAAQQLGAADGNLPFGDLVATAGLLKWHGARLAKGGLPSALADCLTYNPFRGSGHVKRMQQAIALSLQPGEYVAFRSRAFGSTKYDFGPEALPSKPMGARNVDTYPYGKRNVTLDDGETTFEAVSDMDAAWAIRNGKLLSNAEFMSSIASRINTLYGKDVVMHGPHINGMLLGAKGAGDKYLGEQVYVYSSTGYVDSGNMVEMLVKYLMK